MANLQKVSKEGPSTMQAAALLQRQQLGTMQFQDHRASSATAAALQAKMQNGSASMRETAQLQAMIHGGQVAQFQSERGGLPSQLRAGIESLSGMNMGGVQVNYNSSKPKQLQAHAYAQGNSIHLGPGQEKHLPHEAWHVVQQAQGRVKPTMQMAKVNINDDRGLEGEADRMGAKALQVGKNAVQRMAIEGTPAKGLKAGGSIAQLAAAPKGKGKKKK